MYGVTVSPTCDSVFASAGEDGQVLLYDMREPASTGNITLVIIFYNVKGIPERAILYLQNILGVAPLKYFLKNILGKRVDEIVALILYTKLSNIAKKFEQMFVFFRLKISEKFL